MHKHEATAAEASSIPWSEREFVTVQDAAEICGVSRSSLYQAAKKQEIAFTLVMGRTVIAPAEIKRFLQKTALPWKPNPKRVAQSNAARAARTRAAWG